MAARMRSARAHAADVSLTLALTAEEEEEEEPATVDGAVRRLWLLRRCSARPMTLMPRRGGGTDEGADMFNLAFSQNKFGT